MQILDLDTVRKHHQERKLIKKMLSEDSRNFW
jgi:hypothetical protein